MKWGGHIVYFPDDYSTCATAQSDYGTYYITTALYGNVKQWYLNYTRFDWFDLPAGDFELTTEDSLQACMDFAEQHEIMEKMTLENA